MQNKLEEQLTQLVENGLVANNFELFSVQVKGSGGRRILLFTVDHGIGGIRLEECVLLNRLIAEWVDGSGIMAEDAYIVEVSSPGIDRPLNTEKDFRRLTGKRIRVRYRGPDQSVLETLGTIERVDSEAVFLNDPRTVVTTKVRLDAVLEAKPEIFVS